MTKPNTVLRYIKNGAQARVWAFFMFPIVCTLGTASIVHAAPAGKRPIKYRSSAL